MAAPMRSQNGLSANDRSLIRSATIAGTDVRVAVRKGPVGDLLLHIAARWHREVEPLRAPDGVLDCWGYAERTIRGSSTTLSNHASGSALDFRARIHPLGKSGTYTRAQVAAIRDILDDCRGAVRWGADFSRPDEMHIEAVASEAACARVLAQLTGHPSALPVTPKPSPTAPADQEDHVNVPIHPDSDGRFHCAAKVEVAGGTATGYTRAWITLGSTWGDTDFIVTALGASGPLWQWAGPTAAGQPPKPFRVLSNHHWSGELPAGSVTVTVEGAVVEEGAVPCAAVWHVR